MDGEDRNFVTALARGLELLRAFGPTDDYLGNAELSRRTGIPRPTVSRLTYTLASLGYLVYAEGQEKYRIGQSAMLPGQRYLSGAGIRDVAQPLMQSLAFATGCTVALAAPDRHDMLYLEVCQPRGALVMRLNEGIRKGLEHPDTITRFHASGNTPTPSSPEEMIDYTRREMAKFSKIIKAAGVKIEE